MGSVYKPKDKNVLYLQFKDAAGKWCQRSSKLRLTGDDVADERQRRRARAMLDKIEARIAAGARLELQAGGHPTVRRFAENWIANRKSRGLSSAMDDEARLRHAMPYLGDLKPTDVRVRHLREMMRELGQRVGRDKDDLSPRTVRHVYQTLHTMFEEAVSDELIDTNPCKLKKTELPKKVDKNPEWRSQAVFTRAEVETIISDRRVPWDRRVLCALLALTGMRFGEVAALRWKAIDTVAEPLAMMSVHNSYCTKTKREKGVKSGVPRRVPVHPVLAAILAEWKLRGWEELMGRPPNAADLVVPTARGKNRDVRVARVSFHADLDLLGLRKRRQHDLRRTFITLCRTDGARKDLLDWITHGPSGDMLDTYTTFPWPALCAEVSKLKVERHQGKLIALPMPVAVGDDRGDRRGTYSPLTTLDPKRAKPRENVAEVHGNRTRRTAALTGHHRF